MRPGRFARDHAEIVRLFGTLDEPGIKAKGTDEDVLTATFKAIGDDMTPEYRYLRPNSKKQVVAIIYHADRAPRETREFRASQPALFDPTPDASVEVLACPGCSRIARGEGLMPGAACPFCAEADMEIMQAVAGLRCASCNQEPELVTAQQGDTCTLCGEGQYAITTGGRNGMSCQETCEKQETQEAQPTEGEQPAGEPETQGGEAPEGGEAEEKAEE